MSRRRGHSEPTWEEPRRGGVTGFYVGSGLLFAAIALILVYQNMGTENPEAIVLGIIVAFVPWFVLTCIVAALLGFVGGPTSGWLGEKDRDRMGGSHD